MLARLNRLSDRRDINRVRRYGKTVKSKGLDLKFFTNTKEVTRVTVIVSAKVAKKATVRNRIRRRVIGVIQELWAQLPAGIDLLLIVRADLSKQTTTELRKEIAQCLEKAGLPIVIT